ncbi:MAG: 2-dehydropantoate 2-reductase [Armatimonadetes bacterium]|nr:2-dehydropantoate 2-reductase [Armatimonadota bacterium]
MEITIWGSGAIGGTIGAYLARAGEKITFVDASEEHVRAVRECGLTIKAPAETFTVQAPAFTPTEVRGPLSVVFLAVKAMHTETATRQIAPHLTKDSYVVSFQNGLNELTISDTVGKERTVGCFINFGADYLEPGVVTYGGPGALYLGELDGQMTPRLREIHAAVSKFLPTVRMTGNVWGYLWGKLGYASVLFATALVNEPIWVVLKEHGYRPLLANLVAEVVRAAEARGVRCEGFDGYEPHAMRFAAPRNWPGIHESFDVLVTFNRNSGKQYSGIWRDRAVRKRKTEVDHQIGLVVDLAEKDGIDLPLNRRLTRMIRDLEEGRRVMSWTNVDELVALNDSLPAPYA